MKSIQECATEIIVAMLNNGYIDKTKDSHNGIDTIVENISQIVNALKESSN